jgi:hypothetical protein
MINLQRSVKLDANDLNIVSSTRCVHLVVIRSIMHHQWDNIWLTVQCFRYT